MNETKNSFELGQMKKLEFAKANDILT